MGRQKCSMCGELISEEAHVCPFCQTRLLQKGEALRSLVTMGLILGGVGALAWLAWWGANRP